MTQFKTSWRLWISLLFCLYKSNLAANKTLPFHNITDEDGLPTNQVMSLMQDREGFMWIGSSMGLSRYDGYRFIHYQHDSRQPHGLSDSNVWGQLIQRT